MVHEHCAELVVRRQQLLKRSAELRLSLASQAQGLSAPLAAVDRARAAVQWLYSNPQWPLGALAALVLLRPRRALRWAARLWWGWNVFQSAGGWLAALPLRRR